MVASRTLSVILGSALAFASAGFYGTPADAFAAGASGPSALPASPMASAVPDTTVLIEGIAYTCAKLIDAGEACAPDLQSAFDRWGQAIDAYVNSGRLGPLGAPDGLRYEDVATAGFAACIIADRGDDEQAFIDYMRTFYPDATGVALLPLWFGARDVLCPDAFGLASAVPDTTVLIDGRAYTCAKLIEAGEACAPDTQRAFDRWGQAIDAYVNSGRLGPLGAQAGLRYEDVAAAGFAACIIADRGDDEQMFIDYMRGFYPDATGVALLPLWFGARDVLCPDAFGPRTRGDQVTP